MIKNRPCFRPCLLTAMALLSITTVQGGTTAQTDMASITVTPLTRQAGAKADWQTIYDYSGGALPPGTLITAQGRWIDPPVHQDQSGVTFAFPDLPDSPENAQLLKIGFGFERPLADYPTRATISYTSFFDQSMSAIKLSPFTLTTNNDRKTLFGENTVIHPQAAKGGQKKPTFPAATDIPVKLVGDNTFVVTMDGKSEPSITMNGQDANGFLIKNAEDVEKKLIPGAMLMDGLALDNMVTQFPHNKGDWFAVRAFKIEQLRPPLEDSSEAAVDLTVPGSEPVTVTIEVVDAWNDSKGYVLREALVSPGKYRLYWDGIDQNNIAPENTAWIGAGSYTFRLTTSKAAVHYVGQINNSAPKYTTKPYSLVVATALAITPPGTTAQTSQGHKWNAVNNADDTRKMDATDSVQMLNGPSDDNSGIWVAADGAVINTSAIATPMTHGRSLAMTPPDPSDPTNPDKQFYFASPNGQGGYAVISASFTGGKDKRQPKTLTSPDWNRTKPGFVPYQIQIGQIPGGATLGPQHELFFEMGKEELVNPGTGKPLTGPPFHAEWVFRNIRLYEEGSPDPGPMTFDPAKFSTRTMIRTARPSAPAPMTAISETTPPIPAKTPPPPKSKPVLPGTVMVEDNGHAVHLKNADVLNYPFNYTVTPNTIMAFDLEVIDHSKVSPGNGIGLSPDASGSREDAQHYFEFMGGPVANDPRYGFNAPSLGAYSYPTYQPNTLYTDSIPLPPVGLPSGRDTTFLWQPGFYGLKINEDGKFLFACNNADNRLEVRDISTDGSAIAKIPIDYPMFVTLAPEGEAGARQGTRFVYVDSPKAGLLRIAWNLSDNTFGKPETITPASEFAYPRGLTYSVATGRIFVCDTFNLDRSKEANQIVVIDPKSGTILSRFGKKGGVNPATGGAIDDETFTCPLTIDADSKGNLWVNDYYSCEVRKYNFDPATNGFKVERRVMGPNITSTSQFYWLPDGPPTQAWTLSSYFVRNEADFDSEGCFTNQRATSATYSLTQNPGRPYAHFSKVGDQIYATFADDDTVYEKAGDGWAPRFAFGANARGKEVQTAELVARKAGLLAKPGEPPTDLDKAIAASGDPDWATRPWVWSDLNGDGKMEYSADNPEFKIAFGSDFSFSEPFPSTSFRSSDGAYVVPVNDEKNGIRELLLISPQMVNGKVSYDWKNAKTIPCADGPEISDVLAQDGRYYVLRSTHTGGETNPSCVECYDESGKLLWTREHNNIALQTLQSLGDGMISVMDRGWANIGPVMIRTKDGDLVNAVSVRDPADSWCHTALRADADTGYIGLIQAYKVTGLSTIKSAAATVNLPRAGL